MCVCDNFGIGCVSICEGLWLHTLVSSPSASSVAGVVTAQSPQSCAFGSISKVSATIVVSTVPKASLNTLSHPEQV